MGRVGQQSIGHPSNLSYAYSTQTLLNMSAKDIRKHFCTIISQQFPEWKCELLENVPPLKQPDKLVPQLLRIHIPTHKGTVTLHEHIVVKYSSTDYYINEAGFHIELGTEFAPAPPDLEPNPSEQKDTSLLRSGIQGVYFLRRLGAGLFLPLNKKPSSYNDQVGVWKFLKTLATHLNTHFGLTTSKYNPKWMPAKPAAVVRVKAPDGLGPLPARVPNAAREQGSEGIRNWLKAVVIQDTMAAKDTFWNHKDIEAWLYYCLCHNLPPAKWAAEAGWKPFHDTLLKYGYCTVAVSPNFQVHFHWSP